MSIRPNISIWRPLVKLFCTMKNISTVLYHWRSTFCLNDIEVTAMKCYYYNTWSGLQILAYSSPSISLSSPPASARGSSLSSNTAHTLTEGHWWLARWWARTSSCSIHNNNRSYTIHGSVKTTFEICLEKFPPKYIVVAVDSQGSICTQ